jgi:hypothetical protein
MSEGDGEKEGSLPSSVLERIHCSPARPQHTPTDNKVPHADRHGVPNHLLSAVCTDAGELRVLTTEATASVTTHGRVPIVAGGSNSLIHALLTDDRLGGVEWRSRLGGEGMGSGGAASVPGREWNGGEGPGREGRG